MNPIIWRPSAKRQEQANITHFMARVRESCGVSVTDYESLYRWSIAEPAAFWDLLWRFAGIIATRKGTQIVKDAGKMPGAKWFPEARLNYAENLLLKGHKDQCALVFHNENGESGQLSYGELYRRVSQLAQALRRDGVGPGDRVAGILPNRPESIIAMLAATSLGAVWSSCSPDFGVAGIVDRFSQISPKVLFAGDGYVFNGKAFDRSSQITPLLQAMPSVERLVLIPVINNFDGPDEHPVTLWQNYLAGFPDDQAIAFAQLPFDAPLFILYSSGTTGPPKCIVHGIGGTLIQHVKEHRLHTDIHAGDRLFYYTTCGWMMWNWLVSGLASGAALVVYDGSPLYPAADALFDLIDAYRINAFGVSAKYIDALKKAAVTPRVTHSLASLRTILSTGSPLAPDSFDFVYESVKSDVCLSSISGGTDIISCFVLGCPILPIRRGEIQCRGLAMRVEVYDDEGRSVMGKKGDLVCTAPFPSMPVGFWNDPEQRQYRAAYFEKFPDLWSHGDYVALTDQGGMIMYGRSDAVLNPGGVRIGTAEIYRQVEQIDEVLESLVVGQDYDGDCRLVLFVVLRPGLQLTDPLIAAIKQHIRENASPRHVPALILQVTDIPRTKNGKIVELAVRDIIHGRPVRNRQALANPEALEQFGRIVPLLE